MADEPSQTPEGKEEIQTPEGTTGKGEIPENKTPAEGDGLPPEVDYKKKFSDSAREVQRLLNEDKLKEQRMAELEAKLTQVSENSSQFLPEKYPDWDMMTETEKHIVKKQEEQEKELAKLRAEKEWTNNLARIKKTFPELTEHDEEFQDFCQKNSGSIDVLAKSFLFDKKPTEEKPRKGVEKPTGGLKSFDDPNKWTSAEVARLRETDEKKYLELIRKGIIKGKDIK